CWCPVRPTSCPWSCARPDRTPTETFGIPKPHFPMPNVSVGSSAAEVGGLGPRRVDDALLHPPCLQRVGEVAGDRTGGRSVTRLLHGLGVVDHPLGHLDVPEGVG